MSASFPSVNSLLWLPDAAPAVTPPSAGFRSPNSLLWIPDARPVAPPSPHGFRSFHSLLWLPEARPVTIPAEQAGVGTKHFRICPIAPKKAKPGEMLLPHEICFLPYCQTHECLKQLQRDDDMRMLFDL